MGKDVGARLLTIPPAFLLLRHKGKRDHSGIGGWGGDEDRSADEGI